eukprot:scaffold14247_cov140-Isochrysis_galbana.AAC.5
MPLIQAIGLSVLGSAANNIGKAVCQFSTLAGRVACRRGRGALLARCAVNGSSLAHPARERLRYGHPGRLLALLPVRTAPPVPGQSLPSRMPSLHNMRVVSA